MAHASTDNSGLERLKNILDLRMSRAPGARAEADLCLCMKRWGGSPLLMVLDASFTSVGLGYFRSVVPAVQRFQSSGLCCSLRDLEGVSMDVLRPFWKNRRSWEVALDITSHLVRLQEERSLSERQALACWARSCGPENWKEDHIGQVFGVGINTFQYLRMMGGVDTAMPDKIVKRVVEGILRDAGLEMDVEGDLALIETVNEIGRITGYRSADICWMCWLLQ
jgi:hypothetical protein